MDFLQSVLEAIATASNEIMLFFTVYIPDMIERFVAYFIEYSIMLKLKFFIWSVDFAFGVAGHIMTDLGIPSLITSSLGNLPADLQYVLSGLRMADSLNFVLDCVAARFVMNFMGW